MTAIARAARAAAAPSVLHKAWRCHPLARGIALMLACSTAAPAGAQLVLPSGSNTTNRDFIQPGEAAMGRSPPQAKNGKDGKGLNDHGGGRDGEVGDKGEDGGTGATGTSAASGSRFTLSNLGPNGKLIGGAGGRGGTGGTGGNGGNGSRATPSDSGVCLFAPACHDGNPAGGGAGGRGGAGGTGGAGVSGSHFTLINSGVVHGGRGGLGGLSGAGGNPGTSPNPVGVSAGASGDEGLEGAGGAGVVSTGFSTVINSGLIAGHAGQQNFDGSRSADGHAIDFSGGRNRLVLQSTDYMTGFIGNVVSTSGRLNGGDTLEFGMAGDATFSLQRLQNSFIGFAKLAKSGAGTVALTADNTNSTTAKFTGSASVSEGKLVVGRGVTLVGNRGSTVTDGVSSSLGVIGGSTFWVTSETNGATNAVPSVLKNIGRIEGGQGADGDNQASGGEISAGAGGFAVLGSGFVLNNDFGGVIQGGKGGKSGRNFYGLTPAGAGGVGVRVHDTTLVNAGTISGGMSGDGFGSSGRANAIEMVGDGSTLSLRPTSVIEGQVVSTGNNTLDLGGSDAGSFNAGLIGTQYVGFTQATKTGDANWTLTGNSTQAWVVRAGTLTGNTSAMAGNLRFDRQPDTTANVVFNQTTAGTYAGTLSGDGSVTVMGGGTITFTQANSHTGRTRVSAGKLVLSGAGRFGAGLLLLTQGTQADMSGITASSSTVGALQGAGTLVLGSKNLRVDGTADFGFSGVISGAGSLTKDGTGTQVLNGTNTFAGGTQINAGVLQINSAASLGSGAVSFGGGTLRLGTGTVTLGNAVVLNTGGGTFQVDSGASLTLTKAVGGSGGFSKTGAGTLALNAGLTTQQLALSAGTLAVSSAIITAGGTGTMSGGSFSGTLDNHGSFSYSGGSFNGALTNASAGSLGLATVLRAGGAVVNQGRVDLNGLSAGLVGSTLRNDGVIHVTGGGGGFSLNNSVATLGVTAPGQSIIHNGKLVVDNATLAVTSHMLNAMASTVEVKGGSWVSFHGVFAGGQVDVAADSVALFQGQVFRVNGVDFSGAGTRYYYGGLGMFFDVPGLMVDAGSVFFGSANVLTLSIGGTTQCTSACFSNVSQRYSHYDVAGGLALGGVLKLGSASGFVAQAGDHFDLLDWGSLQGRFSGIDTSGLMLAAGTRLDTSALYTTGEISVTSVPEPAHWALLLAGLAGLGWQVRRQRRAQAVA